MRRLIIPLVVILSGCAESSMESRGTTFSDSAGIPVAYTRISDTSRVCELSEPTVRIGSVAGDPASQLFGVRDAVRLDDGRIAVLNVGTDQIRIFDPRGELVRQFGRRGQGPGEFKLLWSLDLRGADTLVVGEYRPWRFGARASFAHYPGDTLAYASGRSEQVELWSVDGRLERLIRWRGRERDVRAEDVEEWKRRFRENFSLDLSSERARMVLEAQVGDHRPVADSFPALAEWNALLVSPSGHVWVREFRRPFDEGPDRWLGFRPGGEFHCHLMVPERLTVLNMGDGHLLGVERDELDVEYVIEHRFSLGAEAAEP